MSKLTIVDEKGEKKDKSKLIIGIVACLLSVSALVFLFIFIKNTNKKPESETIATNSDAENDELFQEKMKMYEQYDIEYTYEDYLKDKEAAEKASETDAEVEVSEPTKRLYSQSDQILDDLYEDTGIDTNSAEVANSISQQTSNMNMFIDSRLGWPDSEYNDDYQAVKGYVDAILESTVTGVDTEYYYQPVTSKERAECRYAIAENMQLRVNSNFTQYNKILSNWMSIGHPTIGSIDSITLEIAEPEIWDNTYACTLKAYVSSGGNIYTVYLASQVFDNGDMYYKVLDIY